jgi:hypothetical protein
MKTIGGGNESFSVVVFGEMNTSPTEVSVWIAGMVGSTQEWSKQLLKGENLENMALWLRKHFLSFLIFLPNFLKLSM